MSTGGLGGHEVDDSEPVGGSTDFAEPPEVAAAEQVGFGGESPDLGGGLPPAKAPSFHPELWDDVPVKLGMLLFTSVLVIIAFGIERKWAKGERGRPPPVIGGFLVLGYLWSCVGLVQNWYFGALVIFVLYMGGKVNFGIPLMPAVQVALAGILALLGLFEGEFFAAVSLFFWHRAAQAFVVGPILKENWGVLLFDEDEALDELVGKKVQQQAVGTVRGTVLRQERRRKEKEDKKAEKEKRAAEKRK